MKKTYFFVLTIITTVFVIGLALLRINEVCDNSLFSIPAEYVKYVNFAKDYGAMTLLCLFAFGGLAGRVVKFIVIALIVLAILVYILTAAAPGFIQSIFGGGNKAVVDVLLSLRA